MHAVLVFIFSPPGVFIISAVCAVYIFRGNAFHASSVVCAAYSLTIKSFILVVFQVNVLAPVPRN